MVKSNKMKPASWIKKDNHQKESCEHDKRPSSVMWHLTQEKKDTLGLPLAISSQTKGPKKSHLDGLWATMVKEAKGLKKVIQLQAKTDA